MRKLVKMILFIFLCIIVFFIFLGLGNKVAFWKITNDKLGDLKVKWNDKVGIKLNDISYGDKALNKYDLFLPADKSKDSYSLLVHIHGGGFNSGDKSEGEIIAKYYASKGIVTATINYSLATQENPANINLMYDELVVAVNHIINKAKDEGYNISEMALTGESAGGCLSMLLAYRYGSESPIPIRFIIQESGPATFDPTLWGSDKDEDKVSFINGMAGKSFTVDEINSDEFKKAIDEISPASYINENTIPILFAYGNNDKIVPPKLKYSLLEALDKYNVPYDYIEFPNSGHGLLGDKDKLKEYHNKMNEYVEKYFENN